MHKYKQLLECNLPFTKLNCDFDELAKKICNKQLIKNIESIDYMSIDAKVFLTTFMIKWFPDLVLSHTDKHLKKIFMVKINLIYNCVFTNSDYSKFKQRCKIFNDIFLKWKIDNKEILKDELLGTYKEVVYSEKIIKNSDHKYTKAWINDISGLKKNIRNKLVTFRAHSQLEQCNVIDGQNIKLINVDDIIKEIGSKQYWDNVLEDLNKNPPKWTNILDILIEIRNRLSLCLAGKHEKEIKSIYTLIDISFIAQMMNYNIFGKKETLKLLNNIVDAFKIVHAPINDNNIDKWSENILNKLDNDDWKKEIPIIMNNILVRLDTLEDQIKKFRQQLHIHQ